MFLARRGPTPTTTAVGHGSWPLAARDAAVAPPPARPLLRALPPSHDSGQLVGEAVDETGRAGRRASSRSESSASASTSRLERRLVRSLRSAGRRWQGGPRGALPGVPSGEAVRRSAEALQVRGRRSGRGGGVAAGAVRSRTARAGVNGSLCSVGLRRPRRRSRRPRWPRRPRIARRRRRRPAAAATTAWREVERGRLSRPSLYPRNTQITRSTRRNDGASTGRRRRR